MKAIFLANNKGNIDYVYPKEVIAEISKLTDLDENVYTQFDLEENPEKFKDVEYIFSTWSMPGGEHDDFAKNFPSAKALFYAAGSVKYFANQYLDKGIRLFSAFAANAVPVAEFTLAQILLANKGYYRAVRTELKDGYDKASEVSKAHIGNYGAKVGIIGVGMIGRTVIELLKPFKVDVLVFDAFLGDAEANALGVKKVALEELFSECDVVSNHLANVPATVGMITGNMFSLMKPNATFINTGRGAQVDEDGMLRVLAERKDISAVLDVTVAEPPAQDSDFYKLDNVFLTPHIAGSQGAEVSRMAEYMLDEFKRFLSGEPQKYEITKEKLAKMA